MRSCFFGDLHFQMKLAGAEYYETAQVWMAGWLGKLWSSWYLVKCFSLYLFWCAGSFKLCKFYLPFCWHISICNVKTTCYSRHFMSKTTIEIQSDEREMWKQEWLKVKTTTSHWYWFHINLYVIQYIQYSFLKDCERKKNISFSSWFYKCNSCLI